jgi:hypothetical protein
LSKSVFSQSKKGELRVKKGKKRGNEAVNSKLHTRVGEKDSASASPALSPVDDVDYSSHEATLQPGGLRSERDLPRKGNISDGADEESDGGYSGDMQSEPSSEEGSSSFSSSEDSVPGDANKIARSDSKEPRGKDHGSKLRHEEDDKYSSVRKYIPAIGLKSASKFLVGHQDESLVQRQLTRLRVPNGSVVNQKNVYKSDSGDWIPNVDFFNNPHRNVQWNPLDSIPVRHNLPADLVSDLDAPENNSRSVANAQKNTLGIPMGSEISQAAEKKSISFYFRRANAGSSGAPTSVITTAQPSNLLSSSLLSSSLQPAAAPAQSVSQLVKEKSATRRSSILARYFDSVIGQSSEAMPSILQHFSEYIPASTQHELDVDSTAPAEDANECSSDSDSGRDSSALTEKNQTVDTVIGTEDGSGMATVDAKLVPLNGSAPSEFELVSSLDFAQDSDSSSERRERYLRQTEFSYTDDDVLEYLSQHNSIDKVSTAEPSREERRQARIDRIRGQRPVKANSSGLSQRPTDPPLQSNAVSSTKIALQWTEMPPASYSSVTSSRSKVEKLKPHQLEKRVAMQSDSQVSNAL